MQQQKSVTGQIVQYGLMFVLFVAALVLFTAYVQDNAPEKTVYQKPEMEAALSEWLYSRGLEFQSAEINENGRISLIGARLAFSDTYVADVGKAYIEGRNNRYDIHLEQVRLTIGQARFATDIVLIGVSFADIADTDPLDAKFPKITRIFFHDTVRSLSMENNSLTVDWEENAHPMALRTEMSEFSMHNIAGGQIGASTVSGLSVTLKETLSNTKENHYRFVVEKIHNGKFAVAALARLYFGAANSDDNPFISVIGPIAATEVRSFVNGKKVSEVAEIRSSGYQLRYGKKVPADVINTIITTDSNDEKAVLRASADAISFIDMIGPYDIDIKKMATKPENDGPAITLGQMRATYDGDSISYEFKDIGVADDEAKLQIGLIAIEDYDVRGLSKSYGKLFNQLIETDGFNEWARIRGILQFTEAFWPRFSRVVVEDVYFQSTSQQFDPSTPQYVSLKAFSINNQYDTNGRLPTAFEARLEELTLPLDATNPLLPAYFPDVKDFVVSARLQGRWDKDSNTVIFDDNFIDCNIGGRISLSAQIGNVYAYFFSGNLVAMTSAVTGFTLKDTKLVIDTKNNHDALMALWADLHDYTRPDLESQIMAEFNMLIERFYGDNAEGKIVLEKMKQFIGSGSVLSVAVSPKSSRGLSMLDYYDVINSPKTLLRNADVTVDVR